MRIDGGRDASFELDCTDCLFQTVVGGEFEDVLAEIEAPQPDQQASPPAQFVTVHRRA